MATASLDETTSKKIIRQVEFYFSDSNLPRDNFLKKTITEAEDGMVSLALICSFSRMRNHLGLEHTKPEDISEDIVKAVAEVLKISTALKVSEDGKKIGRTSELPQSEQVIEQLDERTIAASPIEYDVKLEDMESFFGQFAKVNSVRLPRHVSDKRLFCGTALIEFSAKEDAARIFTESVIYGGVELQLRPKKDFDVERALEEAETSHTQTGSNRKNNSTPEGDYPKGLIVAFVLKSISSGDSAALRHRIEQTNENDSSEEEVGVAGSTGTEDVDKGSEDIEKLPVENIEENGGKVDERCILDSEGTEDGKKSLDGPTQEDEEKAKGSQKKTADIYKSNKDVVLREDLKSVFQKFGTVKYVDFTMGADSGYIRFEDSEGAQKARAAAVLSEEGGLVVKNFVASLDPVAGDAEKEYWKQLLNNDKFKGGKGNWTRGGKQNRGGGRFKGKNSRSRENYSTNRPNKVPKVGAA